MKRHTKTVDALGGCAVLERGFQIAFEEIYGILVTYILLSREINGNGEVFLSVQVGRGFAY